MTNVFKVTMHKFKIMFYFYYIFPIYFNLINLLNYIFFFQIDKHAKENHFTLSTNVFMSLQDNSDENVDCNNGIYYFPKIFIYIILNDFNDFYTNLLFVSDS